MTDDAIVMDAAGDTDPQIALENDIRLIPMYHHGLNPAGIITADEARACKPHRELFDFALKQIACDASGVIMIGNAYDTDYTGAQSSIKMYELLRSRKGATLMKTGTPRQPKAVSAENTVTEMLAELLADERVQQMRGFVQHGRVSTYDHCLNVAMLSFRINRLFSIRADLKTLLTGAMLHDFFLYDWHDGDASHGLHGFTHAASACRNASEQLKVSDEIRNVIFCHMWPLNIKRIPPSREAWVVCVADKLAALQETLFRR